MLSKTMKIPIEIGADIFAAVINQGGRILYDAELAGAARVARRTDFCA
jgi:hypothetical protein